MIDNTTNSRASHLAPFIALCLLAAASAQSPDQPTDRFIPDHRALATPFALSPARPEAPATRPSHVPRAALPPAQLRATALAFPQTQPSKRPTRPVLDTPPLASIRPVLPAQPTLAAAPKFSIPTDPQPWIPFPNLVKLRPESPVRPHEPVTDPTGNTSLAVLPIWRTTPAASHRARIPDPFENNIPLSPQLADEDPSVPPIGLPSRINLPLEKLPPPPASTTQPTTQPAK